jgi:hypothetical protein
MRKEVVVAKTRYYPGIFLEAVKKITEIGDPGDLRTEHLTITSL